MRGMRLASAFSTDEARRVAYCSSAVPPEIINTTMAAHQVLAQQDRRDNRSSRQQIRAELASKEPLAELEEQRHTAAGNRKDEGEFVYRQRGVEAVPQHQVQCNRECRGCRGVGFP